MADPIDELIKEIAGKHGVAVSRDDPIMILQTINARLLEDSAKAQQAMLERYREELEALSARWSSDAKEKAERVLNSALKASNNAMRERARETGALRVGRQTGHESPRPVSERDQVSLMSSFLSIRRYA
jgi:cell division septum initiation protein DivIVA